VLCCLWDPSPGALQEPCEGAMVCRATQGQHRVGVGDVPPSPQAREAHMPDDRMSRCDPAAPPRIAALAPSRGEGVPWRHYSPTPGWAAAGRDLQHPQPRGDLWGYCLGGGRTLCVRRSGTCRASSNGVEPSWQRSQSTSGRRRRIAPTSVSTGRSWGPRADHLGPPGGQATMRCAMAARYAWSTTPSVTSWVHSCRRAKTAWVRGSRLGGGSCSHYSRVSRPCSKRSCSRGRFSARHWVSRHSSRDRIAAQAIVRSSPGQRCGGYFPPYA
jgi:hypothetical protein